MNGGAEHDHDQTVEDEAIKDAPIKWTVPAHLLKWGDPDSGRIPLEWRLRIAVDEFDDVIGSAIEQTHKGVRYDSATHTFRVDGQLYYVKTPDFDLNEECEAALKNPDPMTWMLRYRTTFLNRFFLIETWKIKESHYPTTKFLNKLHKLRSIRDEEDLILEEQNLDPYEREQRAAGTLGPTEFQDFIRTWTIVLGGEAGPDVSGPDVSESGPGAGPDQGAEQATAHPPGETRTAQDVAPDYVPTGGHGQGSSVNVPTMDRAFVESREYRHCLVCSTLFPIYELNGNNIGRPKLYCSKRCSWRAANQNRAMKGRV
jgi:hypothetical protein